MLGPFIQIHMENGYLIVKLYFRMSNVIYGEELEEALNSMANNIINQRAEQESETSDDSGVIDISDVEENEI